MKSCYWLTFWFSVLLPVAVLAQSDLPLAGVITGLDGQAIPGVEVSGSIQCCPDHRERVTSDDRGQFHLEHPGSVLHFFKAKLRPKSVIPDYATSWVHVEMEPASDSLVLPTCGKVVRGSRRLSYGRFGLRFDLSKQMTVSGGHDVDYAEYVIRAQSGDAALQLWFGPDAIGSEPDDHYFIDSASFDQRWVVDEKGAIVGIDSSGLLRSGTRWRWMSVSALGGAVYERASVRDRTFFDQIIGAACLESWQPMK